MQINNVLEHNDYFT